MACLRAGLYTLAMLLAAATTGCAVGSAGTVVAYVQQRSGVTVVSIYSLGVHWRTWEDDPGAHVGYSKRTYSFSTAAGILPGWHFLKVPLPPGRSVAQDLMTVGMEWSTQAPASGLTLGYARTRVLARVPIDASLLIEYQGTDLGVGRLRICSEDDVCAAL